MSSRKSNMYTLKRSKLPRAFRYVDTKKLPLLAERYLQKLYNIVGWELDPEVANIVARACAIYYMRTGVDPEIQDCGDAIKLKGCGGEFYVLKKFIQYRGPFTRGYRYISVSPRGQSYKIIKIKVKRKRKNKNKNNKKKEARKHGYASLDRFASH